MKKTFQKLAAGGAALLMMGGCSDFEVASCATPKGSGAVYDRIDGMVVRLSQPNGDIVHMSQGIQTIATAKRLISGFCENGTNPTPFREEMKTLGRYSCISADGARRATIIDGPIGVLIEDESGKKPLFRAGGFSHIAQSARDYCTGVADHIAVETPESPVFWPKLG